MVNINKPENSFGGAYQRILLFSPLRILSIKKSLIRMLVLLLLIYSDFLTLQLTGHGTEVRLSTEYRKINHLQQPSKCMKFDYVTSN